MCSTFLVKMNSSTTFLSTRQWSKLWRTLCGGYTTWNVEGKRGTCTEDIQREVTYTSSIFDLSSYSCYSLHDVNDYYLLISINAHIMLIYISPYLAPTCFSWSPSSGSSWQNSLKLTPINSNCLITLDNQFTNCHLSYSIYCIF